MVMVMVNTIEGEREGGGESYRRRNMMEREERYGEAEGANAAHAE